MSSLFSFIIFGFSVFVFAHQANATCNFKPPFKCRYTGIPALTYKFGLPPLRPPPALLPCPKPVTKIINKPDVTIPLPLPFEIPLGKFCTCQKIALKPAVLPCGPAPALLAPPVTAPLLGAAPAPAASLPLALNSDVLAALLTGIGAPLPTPAVAVAPPVCSCACT